MNQPSYSTIAAWALAICKALQESGRDPVPLLQDVGLNLQELEQHPDSRVAIATMTAFWDRVEQITANPAFGLEVSRYVQPMHFRALGLLMISCQNMQQVIEKIGRYHAMISNTVNIRVIHQPHRIGFAIDPLAGVPISALAVDGFFATIVTFARQLTGQNLLVQNVELMRSLPATGGERWSTFFQCPVNFQQATNCLWFERAQLIKMALPGDSQLAAANEALVEQYLQKMNALNWHERIKNSIQAVLEQGEPTLADTAQVFNLSERTLRRYLQQEGTSFRQVLEEVRREMAVHYLLQTAVPVTDIALRLGFSDSSNFNRAFQRWFEQTPGQYRKEKKSAGA
ncbi:AraC family transcriptional regulator [Thalassolituus sp. ST750PaO-4]|uniref:AraC family transcriptional regulator n=1 Tax=Thalassolituus sp. ST750PaO-4 TaxID=2742965 RepID=UPI001CE2F92E|nr:AraC family transcriptional regulator [Thalassolituus sp. ST750PaO-4]MCA6059445.1 AraC family transcriptional regulator [Thalassolituus sp. ST750PaO-4]